MIRSSRQRKQKSKIIAEMLAILVESQAEGTVYGSRSTSQTDEWTNASDFCAALDHYAASLTRRGKSRHH
ncbi:MAG: hypothetical protein FWC84_02855 [Alphaproteobacteria bacterium]|nr:hypothetical protein [Alphaproteobacteria bacterium]